MIVSYVTPQNRRLGEVRLSTESALERRLSSAASAMAHRQAFELPAGKVEAAGIEAASAAAPATQ